MKIYEIGLKLLSFMVIIFLSACGGGSTTVTITGEARLMTEVSPKNLTIPRNTTGHNAKQTPESVKAHTVTLDMAGYIGDSQAVIKTLTVTLPDNNGKKMSLYTFLESDMTLCTPVVAQKCHRDFTSYTFHNVTQQVKIYLVADSYAPAGLQPVVMDATIETANGDVTVHKEFVVTIEAENKVSDWKIKLLSGNNLMTTDSIQATTVQVIDTQQKPVIGSTQYDSIQLELDAVSAANGGFLKGIGFDGKEKSASMIQLSTAAEAQATFWYHAGDKEGVSTIRIFADLADNNVSNGIVQRFELGRITYTVQARSTEVKMTWQGSLIQAIEQRLSTVAFANNEGRFNGETEVFHRRALQLSLTDAAGQPAGINDTVKFYIFDNAQTGFPQQNRGEFVLQGIGGVTSVVNANGAQASISVETKVNNTAVQLAKAEQCYFVYVPYLPLNNIATLSRYHHKQGVELVTIQTDVMNAATARRAMTLSLNPTTSIDSLNHDDEWILACGKMKGQLLNQGIARVDQEGNAHISLVYPESAIGKQFILIAEHQDSNGDVTSHVLQHWYPAEKAVTHLAIFPDQVSLPMAKIEEEALPFELQLTDASGTPITGTLLNCQLEGDHSLNDQTKIVFKSIFTGNMVTDDVGKVKVNLAFNRWQKEQEEHDAAVEALSAFEVQRATISCSVLSEVSQMSNTAKAELIFTE